MAEIKEPELESKILAAVLDELLATGKTKYNPLYICGNEEETTSLIRDFICRYRSSFPYKQLKQYAGKDLIRELIAKLQSGEKITDKEDFCETDILIYEQVDAVGGNEGAMERLFSALDIVEENGGQIILTSEKLPREIAKLEDRNRTQFEGGLIINIWDQRTLKNHD